MLSQRSHRYGRAMYSALTMMSWSVSVVSVTVKLGRLIAGMFAPLFSHSVCYALVRTATIFPPDQTNQVYYRT